MIIEHTFNICILISLVLASLVLYVLTLHARPLVVIYSLFIEQIFMSKIDLVGGKSIYERVRMQFHPKPPPHLHSLSLGGIYLTTVTVRFFIQRSVFYFPPSLQLLRFEIFLFPLKL